MITRLNFSVVAINTFDACYELLFGSARIILLNSFLI